MWKAIERSIVGLIAVFSTLALALSSVAWAQIESGSKQSLYNGNHLKPDSTPGGPAPVHDLLGSGRGTWCPSVCQYLR